MDSGAIEPIFVRVGKQAASTFSKKRGSSQALSFFSNTWGKVCERAEHAIFVWDEKFGPLNVIQRAYTADLICHALKAAGDQEGGDRYAYFNTEITGLLNHEKVQAGFEKRATDYESIGDSPAWAAFEGRRAADV